MHQRRPPCTGKGSSPRRWTGAANRVTVFTLNYDSLLMSSMLEASQWVYDGSRGRELNPVLDRWQNPALYHLHGSVSWIRRPEGIVTKRRLEEVREARLLDQWAWVTWTRASRVSFSLI